MTAERVTKASRDAQQTGVGGARRATPIRSLESRHRLLHLALAMPAVLLIVVLVGWPIWKIVWISFHDVQLHEIMRTLDKPVTLENYRRAILSWEFVETLRITLFYVFVSTGIALLLGLATAVLLDGSFHGRQFFSTLVIMPWAIAPVFASIIWMFLFDGQFGLLNYALLSVGVISEPISWLVDPVYAMWALIVTHVWKSYPFFTVMILAGLQAIPRNIYEAATVDGAGRIRQFRDVTLPGLRQVLVISGVLSLLSSFRDIETILVMTKGGPARMTETLAVRIYNENFEYFDVGVSSAMGVVGFLISLVSIVLFFRILQRDFYQ